MACLRPKGNLLLQSGARPADIVTQSTSTLLVGLVTRIPCTLTLLTPLGRPLCTKTVTVMNKVISMLVVRGTCTFRVGPSSPAVIRGGLAVLMVSIILEQHGCRAVSHYTQMLVSDL